MNDRKEFNEIIHDIAYHPEFRKLAAYKHHIFCNRYQHCINVAWYTYCMCKEAGLDYVSATRGALLHDFFLYNYHTEQPVKGRHTCVHPQQALVNARKYFDVNPLMEDCIVHHMWPSDPLAVPQSREAYIVTIADKYSAAAEFGVNFVKRSVSFAMPR